MKTHCKRGHPFEGHNLYIQPDGKRTCRKCALRHSYIWRKANHKKYLAYGIAETARVKLLVFSHYCKGIPYCQCPGCHTVFMGFLQLDHVRGNGAKHNRKHNINNGHALRLWIVNHKFPKGFQVLCANCNGAKSTGKVCPLTGQRH